MVTIEVFWESDGTPAKDKKVEVQGHWGGCGTEEGWTDNNGRVNLDIKPGQGRVWVSGSVKYDGLIEGRVPVYI